MVVSIPGGSWSEADFTEMREEEAGGGVGGWRDNMFRWMRGGIMADKNEAAAPGKTFCVKQ